MQQINISAEQQLSCTTLTLACSIHILSVSTRPATQPFTYPTFHFTYTWRRLQRRITNKNKAETPNPVLTLFLTPRAIVLRATPNVARQPPTYITDHGFSFYLHLLHPRRVSFSTSLFLFFTDARAARRNFTFFYNYYLLTTTNQHDRRTLQSHHTLLGSSALVNFHLPYAIRVLGPSCDVKRPSIIAHRQAFDNPRSSWSIC